MQRLRSLVLPAILFIVLSLPASATIYYVKPSGNDVNDGMSWSAAKKTVTAAISIAVSRDEVWVAAGTYYERVTLNAGVLLYGGFSGTETSLGQRNWKTNKSILDGRLVGDVTDEVKIRSIVTINEGTGSTARIDGFTIRNGAALGNGGGIACLSSSPTISNNEISNNRTYNSSLTTCGGGIYCSNGSPVISGNIVSNNNSSIGGGIYCSNGSPVISSNTILSNQCNYGGGIACSNATPTITNNTISNNRSRYGGGIDCTKSNAIISGNVISCNYEYSESEGGGIRCSNSSPSITCNTISDNVTERSGAGIYCSGGSPIITNNTITRNIVTFYGSGGGLYLSGTSCIVANNVIACNSAFGGGGIRAEAVTGKIINNTIVGNVGIDYGGGIFYYSYSTSCDIANNIIAFNSSGMAKLGSGTAPRLTNNCVYGNVDYDYSSITAGATDIQKDPMFACADVSNYHIQSGSPCRNAGDDSFTASDWTDTDGQQRTLDTCVDIGADESNGQVWEILPSVVVRVSPAGDDSRDGSSWALAKKTIQAGIETASTRGGEVWVKAGSYNEGIYLKPSVSLYGGFIGTEIDKSQRDWKKNASIIDATDKGTAVTACMSGIFQARIDGFTICNGGSNFGGGIQCSGAAITIANNIIKDNYMGFEFPSYGGAVRCLSSKALISGNSILQNSYNNGIYCYKGGNQITCNTIAAIAYYGIYLDRTDSPQLIANNTIKNNGTGIYGSGNNVEIINNRIFDNGLGVDCRNGSYDIINNTMVGNGCGISSANSTQSLLFLTNNIIAFNKTGVSVSQSSSSVLKNNCVFGNTNRDYYRLSAGASDISADPMFVERASGDYHLLPGSPCIDAGTSDKAPSSDFDLFSRPKDGNGDGTAGVDIGCYEAPNNYKSIADAKALPDGLPVGIGTAVSTAMFGDRFYLESTNRSTGIGIIGNCLSTGRWMTVEGNMATIDGERVVQASMVAESSPAPAIKPLFMNCNAIGGGATGLQQGVKDWRLVKQGDQWVRNIFCYGGANNIGLLIKATGRVTSIADGYFYLDGSTSYDDGNQSIKGIKVLWPFSSAMPAEGSFIEMTAISSCTVKDGMLVRMLRPVYSEKVTVIR